MMYSQKFVASIKVNNKILREHDDIVYLPFSSHFSILLKNLNTVGCKVTITIDGDDIFNGHSLILKAGETSTIERFIRNGNLKDGNKFLFIEKTSQIEEHRGNKLEDGLVRIVYTFEEPVNQCVLSFTHPYFPTNYIGTPAEQWKSRRVDTINCSTTTYGGSPNSSDTLNVSRGIAIANNVGITVPGEHSNQEFTVNNSFRTYSAISGSMIFKLVGLLEQELIQKPITVKDNPVCSTCGKKNKAKSKFCDQCGTSLQLR